MYQVDVRIIATCNKFKQLSVIDGVANWQLAVLLSYLLCLLFKVVHGLFLVELLFYAKIIQHDSPWKVF